MYKIFYVVTVGNAIELLAKRVLSCCLVINIRLNPSAPQIFLNSRAPRVLWFAEGRLSIDNGKALLDGCKSVQQYRRFRSASYIGK